MTLVPMRALPPVRRSAAAAVAALFAVFSTAQQAPTPPVGKRVQHEMQWHGRTVDDPWFWLREKADPEVRAYLAAENAYTEAMTKELQPLRDTLYREMVGRVKQTDLEVPVRDGAFWYYSRTVEGL